MKRIDFFSVAYYGTPIILWLSVIWFFSAQPYLGVQEEFSVTMFVLRKIAHVTEYGVLAWLILWFIQRNSRNTSVRTIVVIVVVSAVSCAMMDEWHQTFVPGRHGRLLDVGIDSVGITIGLLWFLRKLK